MLLGVILKKVLGDAVGGAFEKVLTSKYFWAFIFVATIFLFGFRMSTLYSVKAEQATEITQLKEQVEKLKKEKKDKAKELEDERDSFEDLQEEYDAIDDKYSKLQLIVDDRKYCPTAKTVIRKINQCEDVNSSPVTVFGETENEETVKVYTDLDHDVIIDVLCASGDAEPGVCQTGESSNSTAPTEASGETEGTRDRQDNALGLGLEGNEGD